MRRSVAPSTMKSRKTQWRCYKRFCAKFNLVPLPCSSDQLSLYASHISLYMSYSSILVYLQAVVFASKLNCIEPPSVLDPVVKLVLEGVKRHGVSPSTGAVPLTINLLKKLYFGLNLSERVSRVFWASCLLMFFSLLRVSHVTTSVHNLLVSDVTHHEWGLMLSIRTSKTRRVGSALRLPVCKLPDKRFCPVYWIGRLLTGVANSNVPLFSAMLGREYTYSMFRSCLTKASLTAGLEEKFSGHSFRKGGALYLISLGVPLTQVQERGDWKSMCVLRYLTIPVENRVRIECDLASKFV